jgi:hypothetical protein
MMPTQTAISTCSVQIVFIQPPRCHTDELLLRALGMKGCDAAEAPKAAVIVNNCAASTFLALNSLAEGREVIVSRGELVEIGGNFRIPKMLRLEVSILKANLKLARSHLKTKNF